MIIESIRSTDERKSVSLNSSIKTEFRGRVKIRLDG